MSSFTVTARNMEAIALGGASMGTGGGGDPYIGKLMAQAAIVEHGPLSRSSMWRISPTMPCVLPSA